MRKLFFLFLIFNFSAFAQDTIRFTDGETRAIKVVEVTNFGAKYYNFNNPKNKLLFSVKKDIAYIKYQNGQIDFLDGKTNRKIYSDSIIKQIAKTNVSNRLPTYPADSVLAVRNQRLFFYSKCGGEEPLDCFKIEKLITANHDSVKKTKLDKTFHDMRLYQRRQYGFGFGGLGLGIGICAVSPVIASYQPGSFVNGALTAGAMVLGAAVVLAGQGISNLIKKKRLNEMYKLARIYSGEKLIEFPCYTEGDKMWFLQGRSYYQGANMRERDLQKLISELPPGEGKNQVILKNKERQSYKKRQKTNEKVAFANIILWPVIGFGAELLSDAYGVLLVSGCVVGVISFIPSEITALVNRNRAKRKTKELISVFNSIK